MYSPFIKGLNVNRETEITKSFILVFPEFPTTKAKREGRTDDNARLRNLYHWILACSFIHTHSLQELYLHSG